MIMNKFLTIISGILISILCVSNAASSIHLPQDIHFEDVISTITDKKALKKVEFAFDLHKVVLKERLQDQLVTLFKNANKLQILGIMRSPTLLFGLSKLAVKALVREVTFEEMSVLLKYHNKQQLLDTVIQIVNTQEVNSEVEAIIKALKEQEYVVRVASNINTMVFEELKRQLAQKGSNVFAYFNLDQDGSEGKTIANSNTARKPNLVFFKEYLERYNDDGQKLIIFIDDKLDNVRAAIQLGFIGIHFVNANQLEADLKLLTLI